MRLVGVLLAVGMVSQLGGAAHKLTEEGNRAFEEGRLEEALKAYTEAQVHAPESPELFYDVGNVLYRQGDYVAAQEAFERAVQAASDELRADALFNTGNALFQQEDYEGAIERYRDVLGVDPEDADAKRNLELALRRMQQQEQQQQPQSSPNSDEQQQQDQPPPPQDGSSEPDEQQPPDAPPPQDGSEGEPQQEEQQQPRANQPGQMTPEEAQRLLDALEEQERQEAKERAKKTRTRSKKKEKDW